MMSAERGGPDGPGRPRFPALDPEPPPSARWRRVAIKLAVTVVTLAVVVGVVQLAELRNHPSSAPKVVAAHELSAAPPATILSITPRLFLALSNLREGHPTTLTALGQMNNAPIPAADFRYLATPYGQVISLAVPGHPVILPTKLNFNGYQQPGPVDPFAGHDEYIVFEDATYGRSTEHTIALQALATGRSVSLGTGDNVAGDPESPGVFTSVATAIRPTATATQIFPDGRVELRDAGKPRFLLAAAAQLDQDLHLAPGTQVALYPYPDPAGDKVAITVQPTASDQRAGVVIMTRTGHVITTFTGLAGIIDPAWDSSGKAVAFVTAGPQASMHIWNGNSPTVIVKLPTTGEYGSCLWSPDSAWVLCAAGNGRDWILSSASGATMVHTQGPGFPIAWLEGRQ